MESGSREFPVCKVDGWVKGRNPAGPGPDQKGRDDATGWVSCRTPRSSGYGDSRTLTHRRYHDPGEVGGTNRGPGGKS